MFTKSVADTLVNVGVIGGVREKCWGANTAIVPTMSETRKF